MELLKPIATALLIAVALLVLLLIAIIGALVVIRTNRRKRNARILAEFTELIAKQHTGEIPTGYFYDGDPNDLPPDAVFIGNGRFFVPYLS